MGYGRSRCPNCYERNAVYYRDSEDEKGKYQEIVCQSCGFVGKKHYYKPTKKAANA